MTYKSQNFIDEVFGRKFPLYKTYREHLSLHDSYVLCGRRIEVKLFVILNCFGLHPKHVLNHILKQNYSVDDQPENRKQ